MPLLSHLPHWLVNPNVRKEWSRDGRPQGNLDDVPHICAGKKSIADVEIVRRIHFIYERAGRKFRSDISLWMRWIETCKCFKSSKQLSKVRQDCTVIGLGMCVTWVFPDLVDPGYLTHVQVITKALRRHSTVSELWVEAARW